MGTIRFRTRVVAVLGVLIGTIASAPTGFAATVNVDATNGVLSYLAEPGEANQLTVTRPPAGVSGSVELADTGATILAGSGCTSLSPQEVECVGVVSVTIEAGDLDDSVTVSSTLANPAEATQSDVAALIPATVAGGEGDDSLAGGDAPDTLSGGAGADTLTNQGAWVWDSGDDDPDNLYPPSARHGIDVLDGGAGDDVLSGGSATDWIHGGNGDDQLNGGASYDVLYGGEGSDLFDGGEGGAGVDYSEAAGPVVVTLDGVPDDGTSGENDNVLPSVYVVVGTAANDTLIANDASNQLYGGEGDDSLEGGGGRDYIDGDEGDDTIDGGPGRDWIWGWFGSDVLRGNRGDDLIHAASGSDAVIGGAGNDFLDGYTGRDTIRGGDGRDRLLGGPGDDSLAGAAGRDQIFGDAVDDSTDRCCPGNDTITGGRGRDRVRGGPRRDTLRMRDGLSDRVRGGPGFDRARVDRRLDDVLSVESFF
jgi:Ca2+-binding RTX toxin-like protein